LYCLDGPHAAAAMNSSPPFSAAQYSRYKYGSPAAAEAFARALGEVFRECRPELVRAPRLLMTSSPYAYVPRAATALARSLQPVLNAARARVDLPPAPFVQVDRIGTSAGLSAEPGPSSSRTWSRAAAAPPGPSRRCSPRRACGVAGVQSIANWDFPEMRTLLAPWRVRALTSYPQVLASAREAGLVSAADVGQLFTFSPIPGGIPGRPHAARPRPTACGGPLRPLRHARPRRARIAHRGKSIMKAEPLFECNTCCNSLAGPGLIETLITNLRSRGNVRDERSYPRPFRCNMCFKL
jgi:hypothetical protein